MRVPHRYMKLFGLDDLISGLFGFASSSNTNASNEFIAQQNNAFNAQQAAANRSFNAAEAEKARAFAAQEATHGREFAGSQAANAMAFSAQEAEKARMYTSYMSNSAYQRQVADMKAAGLNPILAAQQGGGASTPGSPAPSGSVGTSGIASSSQAQGSQAQSAGLPRIENPLASALELVRARPQIEGMKQDVLTKEKETEKREAEIGETRARTGVQHALAENTAADTKLKEAQKANADRQQAQVSVLGSGFNPAYYADKLKAAVSTGVHSAKNWWNMIGGE